MVENFQKTSNRNKRGSGAASSSEDEYEAAAAAANPEEIRRLKFKLQTMEEELSEAKLEASRAKSALNTEKTNADIALNELRSRINELEEAGESFFLKKLFKYLFTFLFNFLNFKMNFSLKKSLMGETFVVV